MGRGRKRSGGRRRGGRGKRRERAGEKKEKRAHLYLGTKQLKVRQEAKGKKKRKKGKFTGGCQKWKSKEKKLVLSLKAMF